MRKCAVVFLHPRTKGKKCRTSDAAFRRSLAGWRWLRFQLVNIGGAPTETELRNVSTSSVTSCDYFHICTSRNSGDVGSPARDRFPVLGEMLGGSPCQRLRGERGVVRPARAHHRCAEEAEIRHFVREAGPVGDIGV